MFIRRVSIQWDRVSADSYLRAIPALASTQNVNFTHPVTFFCGENGTGKSTLLEGIAAAYGFNPEGGTRNYHFSTYNDLSELQEALLLIKTPKRCRTGYFFRAESFYNVATAALTEYNDGSMPDYHAQSHGESFLDFMQKADADGLFLMDEPEAALSPQRQLTLMLYIHQMATEGSQFLIATHSPILLGLPEAQILSFDGDAIHPAAWEDTDSYRITKLFLENRDHLLERMFSSEQSDETE